MARLFRRARNLALGAALVSAFGWLWPVWALGVIGAVVGTMAATVALFAWFRADDLANGPPAR